MSVIDISCLQLGDTVLAFTPSANHGRGALAPRKVVRLYRNTTTEWLRLSWEEDGEVKELVTTPGHHFLDRHGRFTRIDRMLESGTATIVLASGALVEVTAERIVYSAETAHLFERAVAFVDTGDGTAAKPVELDCWQTYNIEVEDLHTYVAGGVRVHNDSGPLGALGNTIDDQVFDQLGAALHNIGLGPLGDIVDGIGDLLTLPLHIVGEILDAIIPGYGGRAMTSSATNLGTSPQIALSKLPTGYDKFGAPLKNSPEPSREPNPHNPLGRSDEEQLRAQSNLKNFLNWWRRVTQDDDAPKNVPSTKPVLLDLDGDGIEITELDRSTVFMDSEGTGLKNRTAWAGAGDGVLFYDADGDGTISDDREYVFTEWDPTASDDLAALRSRFDTNGDGKLSGAELNNFKIMVTNADGSRTVQTAAALGITEIRLTSDTTDIRFEDGSAITGQATFVQSGTTKVLGNVTLATEANALRVVESVTTSGGNRTVTQTGYDPAGDVVFVTTSTTNAAGTSITNRYDDNGDGVVDRFQTIVVTTGGAGQKIETETNYLGLSDVIESNSQAEHEQNAKFWRGGLRNLISLSALSILTACGGSPQEQPRILPGGLYVYDPAPQCGHNQVIAGYPPHLECMDRSVFLRILDMDVGS